MAYLQQVRNRNGTGIATREIVARFKYGRVIMAKIQLTLKNLITYLHAKAYGNRSWFTSAALTRLQYMLRHHLGFLDLRERYSSYVNTWAGTAWPSQIEFF